MCSDVQHTVIVARILQSLEQQVGKHDNDWHNDVAPRSPDRSPCFVRVVRGDGPCPDDFM